MPLRGQNPISDLSHPARRAEDGEICYAISPYALIARRHRKRSLHVIASAAKQSSFCRREIESWIASSRSLSSGAHSRDPLARRNDENEAIAPNTLSARPGWS